MFHPEMCPESLNNLTCSLEHCQLVHVKGTCRQHATNEEISSPTSPKPALLSACKTKPSKQTKDPTALNSQQRLANECPLNIDNLILFNINGLYPKSNQAKIPFLSDIAAEEKPQLICITESKLEPDVLDSEIKIENYDIIRTDRLERSGGGVAIYHEETLNCTPLLSASNSVCEVLIIKIHNNDTVICLLYRPPDCVYVELEDILEKTRDILKEYTHSDIILLGDLNFPEIDWSDTGSRTVCSSGDKKRQIEAVLNLTDDLFLNQLINTPTREENTLDLLFTNITENLYDLKATECKTHSDHRLLELKLTAPNSNQCPLKSSTKLNKNKLNFHKADFDKIKSELKDITWKDILDGKSVTDQLNSILETVNKVSQQHTPVFKNQTSYRSKFYKDRRALMRRRCRASTALNKCKNSTHKSNLENKLTNIDIKIKTSHIAERTYEENEAIKKITSNTKYFYSYARKKQKTKERIGPFIDKSTSEIISDEKQIADRLQAQYCSVFTTSDPLYAIPDIKSFFIAPENNDHPNLSDIHFTKSDIISAIKELKSNSAPGLDGFSALLLKRCAE